MAIKLIINVDNPGDLLDGYGAGALLRVERDTTSTFATAVELPTVALTSASQYEIWDAAGSAGSWYRSRVSDVAGSEFSAYSPAFQGGASTAYASVDALRELLQLPDASRDNLLADILRRVTRRMIVSMGFDCFRHPAVSGTESRVYDIRESTRFALHVVEGVMSLTAVDLAYYTGGSFTTVDANDWGLRTPVAPGGPFVDVVLTGPSTVYRQGWGTARLTGVFGYESVPEDIEQAALYWAADLYRVGPTGGVASVGIGLEEYGQPRFLGGMPRITWETVEDYRERHHGVLVR